METAIYYRCLQNIERMLNELDKPEVASRFGQWADRIGRVYNEKLLVTDKLMHPYAFYTSRDNPGEQDRNIVAQALALQFGLVPNEHVADVQRAFLDCRADSRNRIEAGEIGLKYIRNTRSDLDRPYIFLKMARQEEHPSYMRFIRRGMLGTIDEWCYEAVSGLKPETAAYRI